MLSVFTEFVKNKTKNWTKFVLICFHQYKTFVIESNIFSSDVFGPDI